MSEHLPAPVTPHSALMEFMDRAKGLDTDKLGQALDLFKQAQLWQAEREYNEAMARAQRLIRRVKKDNKGAFGDYSTYDAMWDACEEALQSEDLVVSFNATPSEKPDTMNVSCEISKGMYTKVYGPVEWPISIDVGRTGMNKSQARKAAMTYARRSLLEYALNLRSNIPTNGSDEATTPDLVKRLIDAFANIGVTRSQI